MAEAAPTNKATGPGWEMHVLSTWDEEPDEGGGETMAKALDVAERTLAGDGTGDAWLDDLAPDDHRGVSMAGTGPMARRGRPVRSVVGKADDGGLQVGVDEPMMSPTGEDGAAGFGEMAIFGQAAAISPPISFAFLLRATRNSPSIRQNIAAYQRAIDGHGHTLEPLIDLEAEDAEERVRSVLFMEAIHARRVAMMTNAGDEAAAALAVDAIALEFSDAEVSERTDEIRLAMAMERARLDTFLGGINPRQTLKSLRCPLRYDLEGLGNGALVWTRNGFGELTHAWNAPFYSVRLVRLTAEDRNVEVTERIRTSPVTFDNVTAKRTFRRYVQGVSESGIALAASGVASQGAKVVFYKELGDPRIVGRSTGKIYGDDKDLKAAMDDGAESGPALEMLHFHLPTPGDTVYGLVRWEGVLVGALGEIEAEQSTLLFFENDSMPDMLMLVEGGRFGKGATRKIARHMKEKLKGKKRTRGILVLEARPFAEGRGGSGLVGEQPLPKIKVIPLTQFQRTDAQFTQYTKRKGDQIDSTFGNPPMAVGKYADIRARSTADRLAMHAEQNVYQPERDAFDDVINGCVFPILGAQYHRFRSSGPTDRDPRAMAEMAAVAVASGFLTIDEARRYVGPAFDADLTEFDEDWSKTPLPIWSIQAKQGLLAGGQATGPAAPPAPTGKLAELVGVLTAKRTTGVLTGDDVAAFLEDLRTECVERVDALADAASHFGLEESALREVLARAEGGEGVEVLQVERELLASWVIPALGEM